MIKLVKDPKKVARQSWAFRLSIVAAALSGVEMALPLFSDAMPRHVFDRVDARGCRVCGGPPDRPAWNAR